ncbi:MAG: hypothetical protein Fur0032_19780 [Terrimicrobiaceae bacterium]
MRSPTSGFTLFEGLVALGIFALAFVGLAIALDAAIGAGIEAREVARLRRELDNRLSYCLVDPPLEGQPRIIDARENRGIRVEERLERHEVADTNGSPLNGFFKLTIQTEVNGVKSTADTILYQP